MIWNIYFGVMAVVAGFVLANAIAVAKHSVHKWIRNPADWFVFVFRGSPLFIQFFFAYSLFLYLKSVASAFDLFSAAWLGALIVLFLNTAAYSGEIFYGALLSQGRYRSCRRLRHEGMVALSKDHVADNPASGVARLHQ
jgi:polar amino acid transport system permease protein